MTVLVTGAAGFIGFHVARKLRAEGHRVVGIDTFNDYYDPQLKWDRARALGVDVDALAAAPATGQTARGGHGGGHGDGEKGTPPSVPEEAPTWQSEDGSLVFAKTDIRDAEGLDALVRDHRIERICHIAAQAGVRYSLENPRAYVDANLVGFFNILDVSVRHSVEHLVYASSSSVYGLNASYPFSVQDNVDHPVSLYAATKKSNELMAHSYSHLYRLPTTGLRFFTVYGPWGRPDMAPFLFADAIAHERPIKVFNHGDMSRDFTYIDDVVEGVVRVLAEAPQPDPRWDGEAPNPASSPAPYRVYNIGNGAPVELMDFIAELEQALGKTAEKRYLPMQPGDVPKTYADTGGLEQDYGYRPQTGIRQGVRQFIDWFRDYYRV
jgi:UDP-glucuronate 4-epimerase